MYKKNEKYFNIYHDAKTEASIWMVIQSNYFSFLGSSKPINDQYSSHTETSELIGVEIKWRL